jgi:O-glycosyl hydrolase
VDLNTRYQKFEGWGTSLAWWANVAGGYPEPDRSNITRLFFDQVTGLGLNVVRYNIGGGENPAYLPPNSPVYLPYRTRVPGFEPSPGVYDWTQDANQRWVLQESSNLGVTIAEAFSNSPPWWMTNSGSTTGAVGAGDNLNPAYANAFADYLTTVVQHYHDDWGITFRTVEPFNESNSTYWHFGGGQEGCGFAPATQNAFVKVLAASLAAKGINYTTISASDENSVYGSLSTLAQYDATSKGDLSQLSTHTYAGTAAQWQSYLAQATQLNKSLWVTEYGNGDANGLTTASRIITDLRNGHPQAWVYWQTIDSATGWGFIKNAEQNETNTSYTINQKYYVMGNFSRFIHPGYQFVGMTDGNSVAAYDGLGTVVIVTLNNTTSPRALTYTLQNLPGGTWSATPYQTSATQNLAQLASFNIDGSQFATTLPADSVTTFVLTNGQSSPLVSGATYKIQNVNSGLVMTVPSVNGPAVIQKADENGDNQRWLATSAGSNWVLTNVASGLALDVSGFSTLSRDPIDQAAVTHYKNQIWIVSADGSGHYNIINQNSGLYADVTGGSVSQGGQVKQVAPSGEQSQSWTFEQAQ